MKKILTRDEVKVSETWDLTRLFKTEDDYLNTLDEISVLVKKFVLKYKDKLNSSDIILSSIKEYEEISKLINYTSNYQSLHSSVDQNSLKNLERSGNYSIYINQISSELVFYMSELLNTDDNVLLGVKKLDNSFNNFIEQIIKDKKHKLSDELEAALTKLNPVLNAPYGNYNSFKFGDMKFKDFKVNNETYPNSFTMFENEWSYELDHQIRRKAFESFYEDLSKYQTGFGSNYQTQILKEKALSGLKNFNNTTEYLLYSQDVTVEMYNRQIDLIMKHLSEPMQKYANLIKEIHNLDEITFADLNLSIDPSYEPTVTIKEAKDYSVNALKVFGEEYKQMVIDAFDNRWIDFPQNTGKSTGGFCSSPYQKGSYILLNWNSQMNETFVLAHELGHAGHFYFSSKHQNLYNNRGSTYFIEAPSTMNELILADYLSKEKDDLRFRRYVLSNIISRTYYHNFVTHLLEAHFQRDVYNLVDQNKPLNVNVLNDIKLNTLNTFWGGKVKVNDYAKLTWMRQPHYFMGLYPYTYSAGLTISTAAFKKIKSGELSYDSWVDVLKAGGSLSPLELAKMVDVDLKTDQPLLETIEYISDMIDEIIEITKKLNK